MKKKNKFLLILLVFLLHHPIYGQNQQFQYKRELKGITETWHKIQFPNEIFGKISPQISDVRVIGITRDNDTITAPYILHKLTEKFVEKDIRFQIINRSKNNNGYFFTFEISGGFSINQMNLNFKNENFDWRISLEGSHNQNEWFSLLENYRILSVKNTKTDYQFTNLYFPDTKYRYLRLQIDSDNLPKLHTAKLTQKIKTEGSFREYSIKSEKIQKNDKTKQTVIDIELNRPVPVSSITIEADKSFDFYRPFTFKYMADSTKTEKGWKYFYRTLSSGIISSLEKNEFSFKNTIARKFRVIVSNYDNTPLDYNSFKLKGNVYELTARFAEPARYFLFYGNKTASKPNYDIHRFEDKISENPSQLSLLEEEKLALKTPTKIQPLFRNKIWLWGIMLAIILVLGWFSLKMINAKK